MLRGTHLTLYPTCLVHRGDTTSRPCRSPRSSRSQRRFPRDARKLGWGIALLVIALLLLAVSGPLERFATDAATDMAKSEQGVARALMASSAS